MVQLLRLVLCLAPLCLLVSALPTIQRQAELKTLSFDDVVPSRFPWRGFNGTWISDNEFFYRNNESNFIRYTVHTDTHATLFDSSVLEQWQNPTWTLSSDNTKLLIEHNVTQIFRHSIVASYAIYDFETRLVIDVAEKALLNLCVWSPNAQHVIYVKDNDVYFLRNLVDDVQLTGDGIVGVVYNGVPDWVYEEEVFGTGGALWIAPNGQRLIIASFDDTDVREFMYTLYNDQYETEVALRYPKAGYKNPTVTLRHIDLNNGNTYQWHDVAAPVAQVTHDHVLQSVSWINETMFGSFWLNRRQNVSVFQQCNALTNQCTETLETSEPNGWVDVSPMRCLANGERCYFIDYYNNWRNIYEYSVSEGTRRVVLPNAWTVLSIYGYSAQLDELYYSATTLTSPHERHVYKNLNCLTCGLLDLDGVPCTYATASFSRDYSYYIMTCSGPSFPYTKIFRTSDNIALIPWEENLVARTALAEYQLPRVHFLRVPVADGYSASVKLYLPPEIDSLDYTGNNTYPMVVDVYGGPNSVRVIDSFTLGYKDYLITARKVIYCFIDGRGSGNKGKDMLFTINNQMGSVEIEDQFVVTEQLYKQFAFIDAKRTSIWGWSYGGYATALVLARDVNKVFQSGVSVAPVSSWIYYDSIYTERYMGLPTAEDNLDNYNRGDATQNLTTNALRDHPFLLVHGNADDNVHFQQAMVLTKALVQADILFEQVSYPNENHALGGVLRHLYHTIDRFWVKTLNLTNTA